MLVVVFVFAPKSHYRLRLHRVYVYLCTCIERALLYILHVVYIVNDVMHVWPFPHTSDHFVKSSDQMNLVANRINDVSMILWHIPLWALYTCSISRKYSGDSKRTTNCIHLGAYCIYIFMNNLHTDVNTEITSMHLCLRLYFKLCKKTFKDYNLLHCHFERMHIFLADFKRW